MSEVRRKKQIKRNTFNPMVVRALASKHEVTIDFVRQALRGDRKSERAELIQKEYTVKCKEVEAVLIK